MKLRQAHPKKKPAAKTDYPQHKTDCNDIEATEFSAQSGKSAQDEGNGVVKLVPHGQLKLPDLGYSRIPFENVIRKRSQNHTKTCQNRAAGNPETASFTHGMYSWEGNWPIGPPEFAALSRIAPLC
jgi:hypothetical protein